MALDLGAIGFTFSTLSTFLAVLGTLAGVLIFGAMMVFLVVS